MKRSLPFLITIFTLITLFALPPLFAQENNWNLIWRMTEKPFQLPEAGSEMAIVKAGFDTDEDGWGEFLCAYTDMAENYILMYEAVENDSFALVWYWQYPYVSNTFAGITVGDLDNNGVVEIITSMPVDVAPGVDDPSPPRLWVFQWNGVEGENKYGKYSGENFEPNASFNFELEDNVDFRPYSLIVEDVDKDGDNELVVGVRMGDRGREVVIASVIGQFDLLPFWNIEFNHQEFANGSLYSVTTGDLDDDGNTEIYAMIWDMFTLRIFEANGTDSYELVVEIDKLYADAGIDYGALDGIRVADVNGDGTKELYIAGTEPENTLFMITGIEDVSTITGEDVQEFYHIPRNAGGKFRSMYIADPDKDDKLSLMIAGETNGQIYDLEYKGEGDPADSTSWELDVIFDIFEYADTAAIDPRLFYGHPANDMDQDGFNEYVFVNYRSSFNTWENDAYVWMLELGEETSLKNETLKLPDHIVLKQNYPNPFNPATTLEFSLPETKIVTLKIYNMVGQEIATLFSGSKPAGNHQVQFDGSQLTSGTYIVRLSTSGTQGGVAETQSQKIILVK